MATKFKEGDRVRIVDREATPEDAKSGLFQNHFRGLTGTVQKLYTTTNEAAIVVDQDKLSEGIATRHIEMQEQMKTKWLDSISDDAKNRLTPKEREFSLRYTVLVSVNDLKAG